MRASRLVPALVAAGFAGGMLSCDNPIAVQRELSFAWLAPPPDALREGDSATVTVELRDASGQPATDFDGATVELRFVFQNGDSLPGTACGVACTTTVSQGRASLAVAWMSAGRWAVSACVRPPAGGDELCAQHAVEVLGVHAALVTYPADSVGRRVRFPVEARLRLPDGTAVTDQARTVSLRFASLVPETAGGRMRCPEAGPTCERTPAAGVVRLDSVMVVDTGITTVTACILAPNGRERCDPAGPRAFRVVVPQATLRFVTEPSGGSAGVPFATQPVIEALEPDGTRRTDFAGLVDLALGAGGQNGPVLAGTDSGGTTARGTVTVRAATGLATLTDLRVNRPSDGYTLVASAAGAIPDTSAAFNVPLDAAWLEMAMQPPGDYASYRAGASLPSAPTVQVTGRDWRHDPIAGVVVSFSVTGGGGAVAAATDTTDLTGIATSGNWRLGSLPGPQRLDVTAAGFEPVTFHTEGIVPTQLGFVVEPTDVSVFDTIRPAVVVELRDDAGHRVLGATDSVLLGAYCGYMDGIECLQIGDKNEALVGTTARAAVDGRASFDDLAVTHTGPSLFLRAFTSGLVWQSWFFSVIPGSPAALIITDGNSQSATVGTAVGYAPSVQVVDNHGNEVQRAGVTVTFTVASGGGSVTDASPETDGLGRARPDAWTLGPTPGVNVLTARVLGAADSVVFFATGTAPSFHARSVSAGWDFTCAAAQTTDLPYCWGANTYSQLGEGTQTARSRPTQLAGGLLQLTQVSSGSGFACGLATTGAAYCWGNNFYGQLGIDTFDVVQHATPEAVVGGHTFQQISAGFGHACALDTDGAVWCWGAQSEGSLGVGVDRTGFTHPLHVASLLRFTQIDVGGNTSCAVAESGDIWCWGYNGYGGVGNNSTDARLYVPVQVAGGRSYTQVSVGTFHTCGISEGAVYCWGRNVEAQLGIGTTSPTSSPGSLVPVPATGALGLTRQVAAGNTHTCAVNGTGETYCWGANTNGQLGDLTTTLRTSGVLVRTDARFVAITAGLLHTCALTEGGATYCWGSDGSGRLGIGSLVSSNMTAPVAVVVP